MYDKAGHRKLPVRKGSCLYQVQGNGNISRLNSTQQHLTEQINTGTRHRVSAMQHTSYTERAANTQANTYQKLRR